MVYYVVRIIEYGVPKYLFNTRVLLYDVALAKPFSSVLLAKRYFRRSRFSGFAYSVLPIASRDGNVQLRTLGGIVE